MAHKPKLHPDSGTARFLAVLLALLVWQGAAMALGNPLLLVSPLEVGRRLFTLLFQKIFWQSLGYSFSRIAGGFLLALGLGGTLAVLAGRFPWLDTLLRPYVAAIRSVPVASFIILALLWLSGRRLNIFISFLMVFPILYTNVLQGVRAADRKLLDMARVFRVPWSRQLRYIHLPAVRPYLTAGCSMGLGLCWKAGVAAEVIGVVSGSVGGQLYDSKVYLAMADLFAWTVVIVAVSAAFEKLFLALLDRAFDWWEGV